MDKLKCMEVFVTVVETGNFTLASVKLDITSVMVGKQIRQLEELLGSRLLKRNTRHQSLTDAGAIYYRRAKTILNDINEAQDAVLELETGLGGKLRISAPVSMGSCVIAPLLASYFHRFPTVEIELVLSNAKVDLIDEGFDLTIRVGVLPDSGLVARPLRPYRNLICGSPAYFQREGVPRKWSDLDKHRCLAHQLWQPVWQQDDGAELSWPTRHVFSSNDGYALRAAAIGGVGLIMQPEALLEEAIQNGQLVSVLTDFLPPPLPVHLIYLQDPYPRRKLTSLVDFLVDALR
ncbi:LysR family transcriptional regulator [Undibacterium sp. CY18W]|uniref:LysR family transcriptional regulator n=1 Tax=Undibacterium hunanense TaxID=2762292 RepID=A0ABR6ZS06_9BURK|nr:LysR substrate-binding domain-containing protein [Undibacterium hunanense]MBC3918300.1 LysR family transcriptional regulator [Undibacterium hunanense]